MQQTSALDPYRHKDIDGTDFALRRTSAATIPRNGKFQISLPRGESAETFSGGNFPVLSPQTSNYFDDELQNR